MGSAGLLAAPEVVVLAHDDQLPSGALPTLTCAAAPTRPTSRRQRQGLSEVERNEVLAGVHDENAPPPHHRRGASGARQPPMPAGVS